MTENDRIYDAVFGLGEACSCSDALRKANLQIVSYPMDWIFGADFSDRIQIVASGFKDFFEAKDLVCKGPNGKTDIYANEHNNLVFNHDFPMDVPFKTAYPAVREKYDRRINRLLSDIRNARRALAVYIETPNRPQKLKDVQILKEGHKALSEAFPNTVIDLLYLSNNPDIDFENREYVHITPFITKINVHYKSLNAKEPDYAVNKAVLQKIFKQIKISRSAKDWRKVHLTNAVTKAVQLASNVLFWDKKLRQSKRKLWTQKVRNFIWKRSA